MQSRLGELGLQSIDVGGAGDCFFRSVHVSHQLYGNSNHHMRIHTAGVQFTCMRENPERFIESNTENSWLRYLDNMCAVPHLKRNSSIFQFSLVTLLVALLF